VGTGLKENKEVEERIGSNLRRLMSLGRAAGVTVQLATQKPSSDIVPTALGDMVISRVAYACATDAQTDTILGAGACHAGGGGARVDLIPRGRRSIAYAQTESSKTATRIRTFWIRDEHVAGVSDFSGSVRGMMKKITMIVVAMSALVLAGCGGSPTDRAEKIQEALGENFSCEWEQEGEDQNLYRCDEEGLILMTGDDDDVEAFVNETMDSKPRRKRRRRERLRHPHGDTHACRRSEANARR
jgi:hypothetical protein